MLTVKILNTLKYTMWISV